MEDFLEARVGAQEVELGGDLPIADEVRSVVGINFIQPIQHFLPILEEPVLEGDEQSGVTFVGGRTALLLLPIGFVASLLELRGLELRSGQARFCVSRGDLLLVVEQRRNVR